MTAYGGPVVQLHSILNLTLDGFEWPSASPVGKILVPVAYPGILFEGGGQQIQLRTEDRENGDLGAVAP